MIYGADKVVFIRGDSRHDQPFPRKPNLYLSIPAPAPTHPPFGVGLSFALANCGGLKGVWSKPGRTPRNERRKAGSGGGDDFQGQR